MADPLLSLVMFALASTGSPGGATSLATASGAQFGYVRSLPLIAGIAATLALLVALSGTGLSAMILAVPSLEVAMKVLGSAYFLWLACSIGRAGAPASKDMSGKRPIGFVGGSMLLIINPKAWAMAVGVAGSVSALSDSPTTLALILASVFAVAATLSLTLWALLGAFLARVLSADWHWRVFNLTLAALLVLSIVALWA